MMLSGLIYQQKRINDSLLRILAVKGSLLDLQHVVVEEVQHDRYKKILGPVVLPECVERDYDNSI